MMAIGSFFQIYKVSRNFNPRTVHVGHVDEEDSTICGLRKYSGWERRVIYNPSRLVAVHNHEKFCKRCKKILDKAGWSDTIEE